MIENTNLMIILEYYKNFLKIINKKMNLLITGGCGHIGSYVAEHINKIKK